jgi:hypothetical protein
MDFSKIAPYLKNPLVLIGFILFLLVQLLSRPKVLNQLSKKQSADILRLLLVFGFLISIGLLLFGVLRVSHQQQSPIIQQTGACGSNVNGNGNKTDINCVDNSEGKK